MEDPGSFYAFMLPDISDFQNPVTLPQPIQEFLVLLGRNQELSSTINSRDFDSGLMLSAVVAEWA
ncbi:MAG: hypothetical protein WKF37_02260 [Bryobacteraceae bacterium]